MSTVQIHPPQTYSRLFRPWDSKTPQDQKSLLKKENNFEFDNQTDFSQFDKKLFCEQVPLHSTDIVGTYPGFENSQGHLVDMASDLYLTATLPVPLFGMDPVSINLMEQEYARVIAEDAQIKAMNARKQRPKKFKCPHCNVAFSNNGQLKGHIRIHTGERPFKCDVESCGKTFTRNEELTRHKRIHTGLRPFACTICGKKFGRRDHLKKHTKTHMPQDRHLGPAMFVPIYPYLYGY